MVMSEQNFDAAAFDRVSAVGVLNDEFEKLATSAGNAAQAEMKIGPFKVGAVVFASAAGASSYVGPTGNSGIILSLLVDGGAKAHDDSFEGESSSMSYYAAASYVYFLPANQQSTINARVEPWGTISAGNRNTSVSLNVVAIAAKK
jgi:hypothetical protein